MIITRVKGRKEGRGKEGSGAVKPVYNDQLDQHEQWSLATGCYLIQVVFNSDSTFMSNLCSKLPASELNLTTWATFPTYEGGRYR